MNGLIRVLLLLLIGLLCAAPVWALRCNGRLVHTGDHQIEVLAKCGEPLWRERWEDDVYERRFFDTLERRTQVMEEWIYDFGPNRLLHLLRFRNGRLIEITTGDRATSMAVDSCRDGHGLRVGDTKVEVIRKCGPPAHSDSRLDEQLLAVDARRVVRSTIRVDEWTYNFGPRRFLLHLTFEDGRVKRIETGAYGF
ncbi:DUF2845 domain-containing protein [Geoalkalibacter sp.]|uniref:DUF2845 domain-containing protein n=1 Tax=Geoalkalibacter sp. TaxID=3041440 RepID=UPI00272E2D94|nr:DUF2845 domain-containing protein [Geoalkalibacter sp.]